MSGPPDADELDIEMWERDLGELKVRRKKIKKAYGKKSVEYAEIQEEIEDLKEHIDFRRMCME